MKKKSPRRRKPRPQAPPAPAAFEPRSPDGRYRQLFDRNLAGVYRTTLDGRILDLNDSFARILGCSNRADAMQLRATEFYIDAADREASLAQLRRDGRLDNCELRLQRKDGSPLWLLENVSLIDDDEHGHVLEGTVMDITAQKLAEERIRRSEHYFRSLIESSSDIIAILNPDGTLRYGSPSIETILGYDPDAFVGHSIFGYVHPDDVARARDAFDSIIRSGSQAVGVELRLRHKDEAWRVLEVVGTNQLNDDVVSGIILNARDVTERKRTEEALIESESKFRAVAETATCGIYIHDGKHLLYVNRALCEISGYTRLELGAADPWEMVAEPYKQRVHQNFRDRIAGKRVPSRYEFPIVRKDGGTAWFDFSTNPITFEGRSAYIATVFDITERKRAEERLRVSEERYRELFENAKDMILTTNLAGDITSMNKSALNAIGYTADEIHQLNVFKMVPPEHEAVLRDSMQRKLQGAASTTYEAELIAKDGHPISLEVATRLIFEQGKPVGVQAIARDVTERKQLEQQLRQAQKMEAIGRLAGGVAHDFNNLLRVIRGYTELLMDGMAESTPPRQNAEQILKAADRARALTQQLLAFSRKQVIAPRVLDLNALLEEWSKILPPLIGAHIELRFAADLSIGKVRVDPGQIEQVIVNLAVNARDAMPDGGRISISTANTAVRDAASTALPPGDYVTLTIADTGGGMDDDTKSHIFEPFFTTKDTGPGTGLGLSTVYGIVEQAGGYITFDSALGKGTAFHIHLPRVDAAAEPRADAPAPTASLHGSETILLVEDEDDVRRVTRRFLERSGYKVLEAANGIEALGVAQRHIGAIQLLLTDVIMPGMHGGELYHRLLTLRPHVKVLFMSGYTGESLPMELNAEMPTFVQKPFTHDLLPRKVAEALEKTPALGD